MVDRLQADGMTPVVDSEGNVVQDPKDFYIMMSDGGIATCSKKAGFEDRASCEYTYSGVDTNLSVGVLLDQEEQIPTQDWGNKLTNVKLSKSLITIENCCFSGNELTNVEEFMAEGFADAELGTNPSKYSIEIHKLINQYFKR